jgi:hypothetical protein
VQSKILRLQGHFWARVEDALDLLVRSYGAACCSLWLLDELSDNAAVLTSRGQARHAVPPGYTLHLGSDYDGHTPSSATLVYESKVCFVAVASPCSY